MTDRKQTPDVLAEILGGEVSLPATPAGQTPARQRMARPPETRQRWEYLVVSFHQHHGWRPRYLNGEEMADWTSAPPMEDYVSDLGEQGWEMASATAGDRLYGTADRYQMFFKRPKH